ncbi:MAG: hypothetical protein A2W90_22610 [Bacteroidetes bacterium GWF2_42_66]|nr:MAG: hypothetical protein A2W92_22015 [Bacteroidetes bacterium GWA2_42_15]OFY03123.1 MAG: hypothetical protein A2W89_13390 [Bacteroidetes bacterium GWE2_42_39]OFY45231.1 MAG: hypothetical protein A2W90_22610 [Bacteroidetes bacterium GWF2_42_66]HCU63702.1 hypothetical protein [Prolixibacteraceae bacterium]
MVKKSLRFIWFFVVYSEQKYQNKMHCYNHEIKYPQNRRNTKTIENFIGFVFFSLQKSLFLGKIQSDGN